jgi:hypothetical protein
MKLARIIFIVSCLCILLNGQLSGQVLAGSNIHGSFETLAQVYTADSTIGAVQPQEVFLSNSYFNLSYTLGNFTAGVRFEANLNTLEGYPNPEKANDVVGFPYRFISYDAGFIEITAGSFYEQFGSGLVLRAYEEKDLGYDNAFDGVRVKARLFNSGIILKGVIAEQRYYFEKGPGIVRGIDAEFDFNSLLKKEWKTRILLGASFVSKFQEENETRYKLPDNVAAFAGRLTLNRSGFNINGEYAYKINDPSINNNFIYKDGQAIQINTSYSRKGFSALVIAKWADNMSFRSDRDATANDLQINFLSPVTTSHTYSLPSFYPYATQEDGEFGYSAELSYRFRKGSGLGGKYGTHVSLSYSRVMSSKRIAFDTLEIGESGTLGYISPFFQPGDEMYYEDFNTKITKKISKKIKGVLAYYHLKYNNDILLGAEGEGIITSNIVVADLSYRIKPKHSIRTEMQHAWVDKDDGNWVYGLLEYSFHNWFVAALDQYNYGNLEEKVHFYHFSVGYRHKATRIHLSFGRQREGVLCLGGICRTVPASNGLMLNLTHSF